MIVQLASSGFYSWLDSPCSNMLLISILVFSRKPDDQYSWSNADLREEDIQN